MGYWMPNYGGWRWLWRDVVNVVTGKVHRRLAWGFEWGDPMFWDEPGLAYCWWRLGLGPVQVAGFRRGARARGLCWKVEVGPWVTYVPMGCRRLMEESRG